MWNVCIGTYTEPILFGTGQVFHGKGKGISLCLFQNGSLHCLSSLSVRNPSFLCVDERRKTIYAVNELKSYLGKNGGGCTAIAYQENGNMRILDTIAVGGADPCHIAESPNGEFLGIANFASGSVSVIPLDEGGHLAKERIKVFQHTGRGAGAKRQNGPHAHSVLFAPYGRKMIVPDLGTDKLMIYRFDGSSVMPEKGASYEVKSGSGPRFGEFSADGKHFYLVNELGCTVTHFLVDENGLQEKETLTTLPWRNGIDNICSDLHLTPDGKFLYVSNRGHDSICCFSILGDGSLAFKSIYPCGGKTPRSFAIDPLGSYMLVGNQDSDTISVFSIGSDGRLCLVNQVEFETPVCIKFIKNQEC